MPGAGAEEFSEEEKRSCAQRADFRFHMLVEMKQKLTENNMSRARLAEVKHSTNKGRHTAYRNYVDRSVSRYHTRRCVDS